MQKYLFLGLFFYTLNATAQYRIPLHPPVKTSKMPAWAAYFYRSTSSLLPSERDGLGLIDTAYTHYYQTHKFEKNEWTRYYKRWRRFIDTPVATREENNESAASLRGGAAKWTLKGPFVTHWLANDNPAQPACPWQENVYAFDVAASNPSILYAGIETGAVFKSTDKGLNWKAVGENFMDKTMSVITIHPTNSDTVLCGHGDGIYATFDGGTTWKNYFSQAGFEVNDIKFKKDNPSAVLVSGTKGLLRRKPDGTFSTLFAESVYDIEFKPNEPTVAYILKNNANTNSCEFFKSIDGGVTFSPRLTGWIASSLTNVTGRLAVSASDPNKIYAVLLTSDRPRVLRSDDAGETWTITAIGETTALGMDNWQGYYDLEIMVSQTNANQVIVGTGSMYRSTDGGVTFKGIGGYDGNFPLHPDYQATKSIGSEAWITTDGGITYSTDFFSTTQNAESRNNGIYASDFWGYDQGWNEDSYCGGRYHNGNTAWYENFPAGKTLRMGGAESPTGYVSPANARKMYFSDINGYTISPNFNQEAASFSVAKYPNESYYTMHSSQMAFDPRCYTHFYIGNGASVLKTEDDGQNFKSLFTSTDTGASIEWIEVSRANPKHIYACQRSNDLWDGKIWKSTDAGTNWNALTPPTGTTGGERRVEKVILSERDANELWLVLRSGTNGKKIYKSTNGGTTWDNWTTSVLNNVTIADAVHQYGTDGGVYLLCDAGRVFYRNNTLSNWQIFKTGLPINMYPGKAKIFYKENKIRSAGNIGIWESDLYEPSKTIAQAMVNSFQSGCVRDTFSFDSYSINDNTATFQWSFPKATWVSNPNSRNPKVVYGQAGTYSAILTVKSSQGTDSDTLLNLIKVENRCGISPLAGDALKLENKEDFAVATPFNVVSNTFTMSAWIKPNGSQVAYAGLLFSDSDGACGLNLRNNNQLGYHWQDAAGTYNWGSGPTVKLNEWSHVALVITPSAATIYLNGVAYKRTATHGAANLNSGFNLGNDRGNSNRTFKGTMDEVCFYNRALSQNEIRELMHLVRDPKADSTLLAYYQFNDEIGSVAYDRSTIFHAILRGGATRTLSTAPVAAGKSKRQSVTDASQQYFPSTGLTLQYGTTGKVPNGDVVVSRLFSRPDQLPMDTDSLVQNNYWIIENYGQNTTGLAPITLLGIDSVGLSGVTAPSMFRLFQRAFNGEGNTWGTALKQADAFKGTARILFSNNLSINNLGQFCVSFKNELPTYDTTEETTFKNLSLYPNPTKERLTLECTAQKNALVSIKIIDIQGKTVYETTHFLNLGNNRWTLNFGNLSAGRYVLNVGEERSVFVVE
jgi:photosystem II stability/assembly factor-like uncharacterized protein